MQQQKIDALAKYLKCDPGKIVSSPMKDLFSYQKNQFLVYSEIEADNACFDIIKENLYTQNAEFVLYWTNLNYNDKIVLTFKNMMERYKDQCNDFLFSLLRNTCGFDAFSDAVIKNAGSRGYFIAGDEKEHKKGNYFIYRK